MRPLGLEPGRSRWVAIPALIALALGLLLPVTATTVAVAAEPAASVATAAQGVAQETIPTSIVKAADLSQFDPSNIISDKLFFDGNAMTAAEIQSFLDQRIGTCSNGKCLNVSTASVSSRDARVSSSTGNLICSAIQGGTMRVSELIYRVQVACGISAKVILVTLQKEQGLTTSRAPSDWNLNAAMGQACPDTAPCDPAFKGLGPQIVGGVTQLKTYSAARFGKQPGSNYIQYNPNAGCGGTTINIQNWATASLYTYTPYQPNAAALRAGYGLGDGCSSYGNRNFYQYYTDWFGSTQGRDTKDDPIGNLEILTAEPGYFRVAGWAIDPNAVTSSLQVHVYVGTVGTPIVADKSRPDVGAAYPGAGAAHGFDARIPATGTSPVQVCVYAINVGAGDHTTLGCRTLDAMSGSPVGQIDSFSIVPGGVQVSGWALDPDTTSSIEVHFYFDGYGLPMKASNPRPDLGPHYPAYGINHGFSGTLTVTPGTYNLCAYAVNVGAGSTTTLDCRQVMIPGPPDVGRVPVGNLETFSVSGSTATLAGWVIDPDTVNPIQVHVYVGAAGKAIIADGARNDIARAFPGYGANHGFSTTVTLPPGQSNVCAYGINASGAHLQLGCRSVTVVAPRPPVGNFEELTATPGGARFAGWALDPDTSAPISIDVYVDGVKSTYTAKVTRPDVGRAFPANGADHGFSETVQMTPGQHRVCIWALDSDGGVNINLGCRDVTVGG
ncbi:hypothetical protein [Microbacterium binotii]|uniref:hypothetical protein n=1 Tax=Microbacterium binotii TaxID=462710 RepID=UPI001F1F9046|nr:hypothetical protein [Microbacterium binotii]UIN29880.1 hypothetical protein LXM64_12100 [Microbacterium binotii]